MKTLLAFLLWAGLLVATAAEAPKSCAICGLPLRSSFYQFSSPAFLEKVAACESCSKSKDRCPICRLPVPPASAHKLDDGRIFCDRDYRAGVFDLGAAQRIFDDARRDVAGILAGCGVLPEHNLTVSLASSAELKKLQQTLPSEHDGESTLGLTRSQSSGGKSFQHQIRLLSGLPAGRLAAVCAHEYTHTWLNENLPADRKLEKDTIEGFCELIAYKLAVQRQDALTRKTILDNAYTRGQVNAFVEAENQGQFKRLVQWVQTGKEDSLASTGQAGESGEEPAAPGWPPPAPVATPVPGCLMLKGLAGTASRKFALINDATFMKNEEGKVRVGSSNVVIRCLDIRVGSVVIQLQGGESAELYLAQGH